jgi:elongation factor G
MLKDYRTDRIHNVLLAGHGQVGKTTLNESLLVAGGALAEAGSVERGTTVSDFDEEEIARKMSLRTTLSFVEYQDHKINLLDAPGSPDFSGDVLAALHVADSTLILVDAEAGPEIESIKHARYAQEFNVPRAIFVNKMDKERADFESAVEACTQKFHKPKLPIWLPIGQGADFQGVVDLLKMKALLFPAGAKTPTVAAIPPEMAEAAQKARDVLIEDAAEGDDQLTEEFLEGKPLTPEEIDRGLNEDMMSGKFIPVLCGCANRPACAAALLDFIIEVMPHAGERAAAEGFEPGAPEKPLRREAKSDAPFSAFVFKTMIDQYSGKFSFFRIQSGAVASEQDVLNVNLNRKERLSHLYALQGKKPVEVPRGIAGDILAVAKLDTVHTSHTFADPAQAIEYPPLRLPQAVYSIAVAPVKKADEGKMATVLGKLCEEDPTLIFRFEPETHQSLLSAMGDVQLDMALSKLKKKFNVDVERGMPRILYKETIQKNASGHHKHKKQTGGHGQYGDVYLDIAPVSRGEGYRFEDHIVGGVIPKGYLPGIEKGVKQALDRGVLAGYPVIDVLVKVVDGSYHDVDSSEMSFKIAGRTAFKDAMSKASPILLEPVMQVAIFADDSYMGGITSDLNSRRGRILSMGTGEIKAHVPQSDLLNYSKDLKAITSGTASFEMAFSHYQPISGRIAENVIKEAAVLHGDIKEEED